MQSSFLSPGRKCFTWKNNFQTNISSCLSSPLIFIYCQNIADFKLDWLIDGSSQPKYWIPFSLYQRLRKFYVISLGDLSFEFDLNFICEDGGFEQIRGAFTMWCGNSAAHGTNKQAMIVIQARLQPFFTYWVSMWACRTALCYLNPRSNIQKTNRVFAQSWMIFHNVECE